MGSTLVCPGETVIESDKFVEIMNAWQRNFTFGEKTMFSVVISQSFEAEFEAYSEVSHFL